MKNQEMKRVVVVEVILLPCWLRSTDSFSSPCDLVLAPTAFSPSGRESYSDPGTAGGALWVITQRHCRKEKHTGREEEKEKVCVSSEITANKRRAWLLNTMKPQIYGHSLDKPSQFYNFLKFRSYVLHNHKIHLFPMAIL